KVKVRATKYRYNHTGTQFFEIRKTRPLSGLMETAKEMTRESLPIKCLEAVILGIYLTNGQPSVERFPISFKTHFSGNYFHHVVLGIYCNGRYGSLGMSRRSDLMDKPLTYRTLSDLIFDFEDSYKKYLHSVKKVKIGLYVPHEPHSFQPIEWKQLVLNVSKMMRTEVRKELEKFARDMRMKLFWALVPFPAKERLLRSSHVSFWLQHLPPCPDLGVSLARGIVAPVFCSHLSCPAKEF
uniref:Vasohibin 2 n=1 Tax=Zosterops lateralis melanops TaxID=1220523 RepID=A0A8D2PU23_ZOSLA